MSRPPIKPIAASVFALLIALLACASVRPSARAFHEAELIFPLEHWHNHASCIVECHNGDLLVCWFHGSGERTADGRGRCSERTRRSLALSTPHDDGARADRNHTCGSLPVS